MDDPPELFRGTGGSSTLQQIVRAHFPGFQTNFEDEHGGRSLPQYVLKEFQALLECGDPAFGFTRIRCPSCTTDTILPFSCKGRTFCSSCGGRQMAQTAAHLVDRVFPDVDVRQWVLSVPKPLRLAMAINADLCRDVAGAHIRAVSASYIRRAKAAMAPEQDTQSHSADCSAKAAVGAIQFHPGAVNSTQRFASNLALNVHFHSLYLDGVYVTRGAFDAPVFMPAGRLKTGEVERVQRDAVVRIRRVLERYGLDPVSLGLPPRPGGEASSDFRDFGEYEQPLLDFGDATDDSFFPGLKAASVDSLVPFGPDAGQPLKRLLDLDLARAFQASGWSGPRVPAPLIATSDGFSLHAATLIRKGERAQLEKLCRYVTRPAICLKRLSVRPNGMIAWRLAKPWRDGTKGFLLTPYQFIARLAAIVPHPREHQLTYQGVLAPASPLRDQVVPRSVARKDPKEQNDADANPAGSYECSEEQPKGQRYIRWADLLKRVFASDVLKCPHCGGRRHLISVITEPEAVRRVLDSVREGLERNKPPPPETRIPMPPRQGRLGFET